MIVWGTVDSYSQANDYVKWKNLYQIVNDDSISTTCNLNGANPTETTPSTITLEGFKIDITDYQKPNYIQIKYRMYSKDKYDNYVGKTPAPKFRVTVGEITNVYEPSFKYIADVKNTDEWEQTITITDCADYTPDRLLEGLKVELLFSPTDYYGVDDYEYYEDAGGNYIKSGNSYTYTSVRNDSDVTYYSRKRSPDYTTITIDSVMIGANVGDYSSMQIIPEIVDDDKGVLYKSEDINKLQGIGKLPGSDLIDEDVYILRHDTSYYLKLTMNHLDTDGYKIRIKTDDNTHYDPYLAEEGYCHYDKDTSELTIIRRNTNDSSTTYYIPVVFSTIGLHTIEFYIEDSLTPYPEKVYVRVPFELGEDVLLDYPTNVTSGGESKFTFYVMNPDPIEVFDEGTDVINNYTVTLTRNQSTGKFNIRMVINLRSAVGFTITSDYDLFTHDHNASGTSVTINKTINDVPPNFYITIKGTGERYSVGPLTNVRNEFNFTDTVEFTSDDFPPSYNSLNILGDNSFDFSLADKHLHANDDIMDTVSNLLNFGIDNITITPITILECISSDIEYYETNKYTITYNITDIGSIGSYPLVSVDYNISDTGSDSRVYDYDEVKSRVLFKVEVPFSFPADYDYDLYSINTSAWFYDTSVANRGDDIGKQLMSSVSNVNVEYLKDNPTINPLPEIPEVIDPVVSFVTGTQVGVLEINTDNLWFNRVKPKPSLQIIKPVAYIGAVRLKRGHAADVTNTTTNSLLEEKYQNRAYYGKKGDWDETITMRLRSRWQDMVTLQGHVRMDEPIPIDTTPDMPDGDPLIHRGWVEIYSTGAIKKINDSLYECSPQVKYLTHEVIGEFLISQTNTNISPVTIPYSLTLTHDYTDDLRQIMQLSSYRTFVNNTIGPYQYKGTYTVPAGDEFIFRDDKVNQLSKYSFRWRNELPSLGSTVHDDNTWQAALRIRNGVTDELYLEYLYNNFKHYDENGLLNDCNVKVTQLLDNGEYDVEDYTNMSLDFDERTAQAYVKQMNTYISVDKQINLVERGYDIGLVLHDEYGQPLRNKLINIIVTRDGDVVDTCTEITRDNGLCFYEVNEDDGTYTISYYFAGDEAYKECYAETLCAVELKDYSDLELDYTDKTIYYVDDLTFNVHASINNDRPVSGETIIVEIKGIDNSYIMGLNLANNLIAYNGVNLYGATYINFKGTINNLTQTSSMYPTANALSIMNNGASENRKFVGVTDDSGNFSIDLDVLFGGYTNNASIRLVYKGNTDKKLRPLTTSWIPITIKRNNEDINKSVKTVVTSEDMVYYPTHVNQEYGAYLKKSDGTPLANQTLKFTIHPNQLRIKTKNVVVKSNTFTITKSDILTKTVKTDSNGYAKISLGLNSGVYGVTVSYDGVKGSYLSSSTTHTIVVKAMGKIGTQIICEPMVITDCAHHEYQVFLYDEFGEPIPNQTIVMTWGKDGGTYYSKTDIDGKAEWDINWNSGYTEFKMSYYSNDIYEGSSVNSSIFIKRPTDVTKVYCELDTQTLGSDDNSITASFYYIKDNVRVPVPGIHVGAYWFVDGANIKDKHQWDAYKNKNSIITSYTVQQTDSNGECVIPCNLTTGKYTLRINGYCSENTQGQKFAYYEQGFTVVVNASKTNDTHFVLPNEFSVVGGKTVAYETPHSKRDFEVVLCDENNTLLANKNITLTLTPTKKSSNTVTLRCLTDNTGVARFNLNLDTGTYQLSLKFDGDMGYKGCILDADDNYWLDVTNVDIDAQDTENGLIFLWDGVVTNNMNALIINAASNSTFKGKLQWIKTGEKLANQKLLFVVRGYENVPVYKYNKKKVMKSKYAKALKKAKTKSKKEALRKKWKSQKINIYETVTEKKIDHYNKGKLTERIKYYTTNTYGEITVKKSDILGLANNLYGKSIASVSLYLIKSNNARESIWVDTTLNISDEILENETYKVPEYVPPKIDTKLEVLNLDETDNNVNTNTILIFPYPLMVKATDDNGNILTGVTLEYNITGTNGQVNTYYRTTNNDGIASLNILSRSEGAYYADIELIENDTYMTSNATTTLIVPSEWEDITDAFIDDDAQVVSSARDNNLLETPDPLNYVGTIYGSTLDVEFSDNVVDIIDYGLAQDTTDLGGKIILKNIILPKLGTGEYYSIEFVNMYKDNQYTKGTELNGSMQIELIENVDKIGDDDAETLYKNLIVSPAIIPYYTCKFTRESEDGTLWYYDVSTRDKNYDALYRISPYFQYKGGVNLETQAGISLFDLETSISPIVINNGLVKVEFHKHSGFIRIYKYVHDLVQNYSPYTTGSKEEYNFVKDARDGYYKWFTGDKETTTQQLYKQLETYTDYSRWVPITYLKLPEGHSKLTLNAYSRDKISITFGKAMFTMYAGRPFIKINHSGTDLEITEMYNRVYAETDANESNLMIGEEYLINSEFIIDEDDNPTTDIILDKYYYVKYYNAYDNYGLGVVRPYFDDLKIKSIPASKETVLIPYSKYPSQQYDEFELMAFEYLNSKEQTSTFRGEY